MLLERSMIADKAKSIKLVTWENKGCLEADKSYVIEGVSVRSFKDGKYLTTNYTATNVVDDVASVAEPQCEPYAKVIIGSVLGANVSHHKSCILCNSKIQITDDTYTVKCSKSKLTVFYQWATRFLSHKDNSSQPLVTYTVSNTAMNTFLQHVAGKAVSNLNC